MQIEVTSWHILAAAAILAVWNLVNRWLENSARRAENSAEIKRRIASHETPDVAAGAVARFEAAEAAIARSQELQEAAAASEPERETKTINGVTYTQVLSPDDFEGYQ